MTELTDPTELTVLADHESTVEAGLDGGRVLVAAADLPRVLGWTLEPHGLCRGDACVVVRDREAVEAGDRVDLLGVARALDRPALVDVATATAAIGAPSDVRRRALAGGPAPDFALPDLDGELRSLGSFPGRRVLVTFATWCGCAYDLPGWQALRDELAGDGIEVVAVAIDDDPDVVRPFAAGLDLPVLVDRDHTLTELYAISNVPTVVWIDERDRIARPNAVAFGTDTFRGFTGVDSETHKDAVREWARTGRVDVEADPADVVGDLSEDELQARLHFRIAAHLRRTDRPEDASRHFARAVELAPHDWTVRRAAMPLQGVDPFGDEFFAMAAEWEAAGRPYHGLAAERTDG